MLDAGLILSRFLHYASTTFLFGAALYPLYGSRAHDGFLSALKPWLRASAVLAFVSLVGWFLFSAASMAGDAGAMWDTSVLVTIVKTMGFGKLWVGRLALNALLLVVLLGWPSGVSFRLLPMLAALLLASLVGTGHAQEPEHPYMAAHYLADTTHLLAAGAWLGALWPLAMALNSYSTEQQGEHLVRFSRMGQIAVAVLLLSGLVNSWFLVGSFSQLVTTTYGQLLILKIALFLLMVAFAAANRFWITPQFLGPLPPADRTLWHTRLRNHIVVEQALGLLVLAVVSLLGTLQPAVVG